jgi:hypothetical protein
MKNPLGFLFILKTVRGLLYVLCEKPLGFFQRTLISKSVAVSSYYFKINEAFGLAQSHLAIRSLRPRARHKKWGLHRQQDSISWWLFDSWSCHFRSVEVNRNISRPQTLEWYLNKVRDHIRSIVNFAVRVGFFCNKNAKKAFSLEILKQNSNRWWSVRWVENTWEKTLKSEDFQKIVKKVILQNISFLLILQNHFCQNTIVR